MIKVLHILNSLLPSGAETMLQSAGSEWSKDIEHHILATQVKRGEYAEELEKVGYIVHHIYNKGYIEQHRAVREFIKKNNFDVIHIHRQSQAFSYALDAKLADTRKIVRTVHNVFFFHGAVQVREFITRQLSCLLGVQHISISESVERNEWERFRVKTVRIRNWYNDKHFYLTTEQLRVKARKKLNIEEDKYCIVSVGNCTPVKNHMSILFTLAKHRDDEIYKNVIYLHVGKGPQQDEEIQYARDNGIADKVAFLGFDDPVVYLQAADLFVMPSTYEGFGISGIEGAATGIRTLFTKVAGLKDFQVLNLDNLYYSEIDDESIDEAISELVKQGIQLYSKTQANDVKAHFGIEGGVRMYEDIYFN